MGFSDRLAYENNTKQGDKVVRGAVCEEIGVGFCTVRLKSKDVSFLPDNIVFLPGKTLLCMSHEIIFVSFCFTFSTAGTDCAYAHPSAYTCAAAYLRKQVRTL